MNLPPAYPHDVGFEWILPYRYARIREILTPKRPLDLEDMRQLQRDTRSIPAQRVLKLLDGVSSDDPSVQRALALLRKWDGDLSVDSSAGALFEVWAYRHLARAVMTQWIGGRTRLVDDVTDEKLLYDVFEGSSAEVWLSRLEDPSQSQSARRATLIDSLAAAISETESRLGSDMSRWKWGRLHRAELTHPVSALLDASEREKVDVGPAPRGGSGATVNSTAYTLDDFIQRYGASFRMVLDVGSWDDSVAMNTPGQSGDPSSVHYRDLFEAWARDESFPLLYSRERILEATEQRILLRPPDPSRSE
jgi:penicillin amidase